MIDMSVRFDRHTKEQTVEQVILDNYDKYYRLAYSYVHNEADASDIVQNGAYKAILNCRSLRHAEYAATWVYRIMINEIFKFYTRGGLLAGKQMASLEEMDTETGAEDVYQDIDLRRALDSLDAGDKAVVEMRYFEDMKLEEIADVLQENLSTIKSRLHRSLKKLRLKLEYEA